MLHVPGTEYLTCTTSCRTSEKMEIALKFDQASRKLFKEKEDFLAILSFPGI